jgi:RimJ/RimL family protein N-acetyltransferase
MNIQPLRQEDVESYRAIFDSVAREGRYLARPEAPPIEDIRKFVQDSIDKRRPRFLAWHGDEAVGWCDIVEKPLDLLRHSGTLGMGVLEGYRGRGFGAELMARTLAAAKVKVFTRVELTVRVDNPRAKRLYEKFGFQLEGLCRRHMRVRGEYHDSYFMAWLG